MNRLLSVWIGTLVSVAFAGRAVGATSEEPIKVVFIRDGQVFYRASLNSPDVQLTHEQSTKFLPVWSGDGERIAFAERVVANKGLGTLVVVNERGSRLEEIGLGTGGGGDAMRFIESLQWVSPRTLAVSGSANPSLTETRLIDLDDPAARESILDDGPGAVFSPDGRHFAYITGSPHFTPENLREPVLRVDHRQVFPQGRSQVRFHSERVWSADSTALAVVAEEVSTRRLMLVIWRDGSGVELRPIRLSASDVLGLFWSADAVLLRTRASVLRLGEDGHLEPDRGVDDIGQGAELRRSLTKQLGVERGSPDLWCETCALSGLRRGVSYAQ